MKSLLTIILLCLIISSCKNNQQTSDQAIAVDSEVMLSTKASNAPSRDKDEMVGDLNLTAKANAGITADTAIKIIKTGEISFETRNVSSTRQGIMETVKKMGGYVASEEESGYENSQKNYTLNLKVPAKNFDALLQSISDAAEKIDSKNIQIQDVTSEFIDTKTRLQNKKRLELRYLELLNKATKITDMLAIENKISELRGEIESIEGQFIYLQKQIAYSSLTLHFYSKSIEQETGKGFFYKFNTALISGWHFVQSCFFGLLSIWPLVLIVGLTGAWYVRRKRAKSKDNVKS